MSSFVLGQQAAVFHQSSVLSPFRCRDRRYAFRPGLSSVPRVAAGSVISVQRRDVTLGFDTARLCWEANSSSRSRLRDIARPISPQSSSNEETSKEDSDSDNSSSSSPSSREKVELLFTCNQCNAQSRKKVNFQSLQKGTVFLQVMQKATKLFKLVATVLILVVAVVVGCLFYLFLLFVRIRNFA